MNETTAILFEIRALAEQIDLLECQARQTGEGASHTRLSALRGQASALRANMDNTRRRRDAIRHSAGTQSRSTSPTNVDVNYTSAMPPRSRAAGIVARLGVSRDRLFDALHATGTLNA
jgi:hypothetical protein